MATSLSQRIVQTRVQPYEIAVFSLAQAGFCLKTASGVTLAIDPYLSDCVERLAGFKRLIPAPIQAEELAVDLLISTHNHPDHLDVDALPVMARRPQTFFVGAPDCAAAYRGAGLPAERWTVLRPGETLARNGIVLRAVHADHGTLAPEAVGVLIEADGVSVYHTGDTGPADDAIAASLEGRSVDVMIAPINGAYGNLDGAAACRLAARLRPKVLIGCHVGMFAEHGGSPEAFLAAGRDLPVGTRALVMAPGEMMRYRKEP